MSTPTSTSDRLEILLVEDTLEEALLVRSLLEEMGGFKVTLAQDGIRGCDLAENQDWDLVITDLNLPGRDGMDLIRLSKERSPDTPVLAMTAFAGPYVDQAFRTGADDVIEKPVDQEDLKRRIKILAARRRKAADVKEDRTVLAIGAFPGDVEAGCGGILLSRRAKGEQVLILTMSPGGEGANPDRSLAAARKAAKAMSAVLVVPDDFGATLPGDDDVTRTVEGLVREHHPDTILAPSHNDVRESRRDVYRGALSGGPLVPNFLTYQSATTTLEFRPTAFVDIGEYMEQKLGVLNAYADQVGGRPHLEPSLIRATARYWGRFLGYGDVEPLEVVRSAE